MNVPSNINGTGCNESIYDAFVEDITKDISPDLEFLLD
jgi:hypothetical protein